MRYHSVETHLSFPIFTGFAGDKPMDLAKKQVYVSASRFSRVKANWSQPMIRRTSKTRLWQLTHHGFDGRAT